MCVCVCQRAWTERRPKPAWSGIWRKDLEKFKIKLKK